MNLMTCGVLTFLGGLANIGMLLRILLGPFPYFVVVAFHYWIRIITVSFVTMLSFKIVVQTLFILDFDRMAMVAEARMMFGMGACTTSLTLIHVVMEALPRNHRGLEHYPRWCLSVYISKVRPYQFFFIQFLFIRDQFRIHSKMMGEQVNY